MTMPVIAAHDGSNATSWPAGRPAALWMLPGFLFRTDRSVWRYVLLGWPLVALPTIALGWLANRVASSLSGPELAHAPAWMLIVGVVIVSPVLETLIMTGPIALLDRLFGPVPAVLGSAALWGVAYSLAAARWGLVVWWPFLLFSVVYLTWRKRGYWQATGVVCALHALNNAGPMVLALAMHAI